MPLSLLPCCPDHFSIPSRAPATSGYAFAITVQYHPAVPGALQVRDLQIHGQHLPNRADRKHSSHNCLTNPSSFLDEKQYVEHKAVADWHGWGIDFNYERPFWDADATNFVVAVRQAMQDKKGSAIWFHQSGSDSEIHGRYYGYQYFEVWDACAEKEAKRMATMIAEKIQTVVSTT